MKRVVQVSPYFIYAFEILYILAAGLILTLSLSQQSWSMFNYLTSIIIYHSMYNNYKIKTFMHIPLLKHILQKMHQRLTLNKMTCNVVIKSFITQIVKLVWSIRIGSLLPFHIKQYCCSNTTKRSPSPFVFFT